MSDRNNSRDFSSKKYTSIGMGLGLVLGGLVGLLLNNMIIFSGGGMVIGLALGTALDARK